MRKLARVLVGVLVGALGWQVVGAAPAPDTLVVCERAGADLRSPATNGTCPSGYTKTEITESASVPNDAYSAGPAAPATYTSVGQSQNILAVHVPAGVYTIQATGWVENKSGTAAFDCFLVDSITTADITSLTQPAEYQGVAGGSAALAAVREYDAPNTTIWVSCTLRGSNAMSSIKMSWDLSATRVDRRA